MGSQQRELIYTVSLMIQFLEHIHYFTKEHLIRQLCVPQ